MSNKLTKFLVELSADPAKRQRFDENPDAMMKAAGLSVSDQRLLRTKDASKIQKRFGVKSLAHMTCITDPSSFTPDQLKQLKECFKQLGEDLDSLTKVTDTMRKHLGKSLDALTKAQTKAR